MKLLLVDTAAALCTEWQAAFAGAEDVDVHHGRFEDVIDRIDCLVSPANSFGLMDGGIDLAIINFFGLQLEYRVQAEIWRRYRGEQPVGTCLMVPTEEPRCPWLAHCPTMRVPRNVSETNNSYAACLAALVGAESVGVKTLGCPGLATLTGRMPFDIAAAQMRFAYDTWKAPFKLPDWSTLSEREWRSHGRSSGR